MKTPQFLRDIELNAGSIYFRPAGGFKLVVGGVLFYQTGRRWCLLVIHWSPGEKFFLGGDGLIFLIILMMGIAFVAGLVLFP